MRPHSKRLRSRSSVGGQHDLLVGVVEGVEGVEELFLGLGLALEELDVVDEQDVDVAVAPLEAVLAVVADRVDELVGELLAGDVAHLRVGVEAADVVADRVQQVGLPQPGLAVDEQRVVGLAGRLGDGNGGGVREAVGRTDDEGLEGVLRVEPGLQGGGPAFGGRRDDLVLDGDGHGRLHRVEVNCRHVDRSICQFVDRNVLDVLERGVDRDEHADLAAEALAQRVLDVVAQPALELGAGELVGDRDDRGVLVQRHGHARAQPGPLVGLEVLDDLLPCRPEIYLLVVHRTAFALHVYCSLSSGSHRLCPAAGVHRLLHKL
jgi:hypothetical protein